MATWKDRRTLVFYPTKKWNAGETYEANVHLKKIPNQKSVGGDFKFSFDIRKKTYQLSDIRLHHKNTSDLSVQQLSGVLQLSEDVAVAQIEKAINVTSSKGSYEIRWQHHMGQNRHVFFVDPVLRIDEEFDIDINVTGATMGIDHDVKKKVRVPAKGTFQYMSHEVYNGSDQHVAIGFSDPLALTRNYRAWFHLIQK